MSSETKIQWPMNAYGSANLQAVAGYKQTNDWKDLANHLKYQLQETIEQVIAFNERDQLGYRDATADVRVLLDAQQASVTWSLEKDYNEVIGKLYTRFDKTNEDALLTQEKYAKLGVKTYIVHDENTGCYVNRVLEAVDGTDGEHYPAGKWLKSINVQFPSFEEEEMLVSDYDVKLNSFKNAGTYALIGDLPTIRKLVIEEELKQPLPKLSDMELDFLRSLVCIGFVKGIQAHPEIVGNLLKSGFVYYAGRSDRYFPTELAITYFDREVF